jgi:putative heme-binding domain-containing protein
MSDIRRPLLLVSVAVAILCGLRTEIVFADDPVAVDPRVAAAIEAARTESTREAIASLIAIDEEVAGQNDEASQKTQALTIRVLAQSADERALDYVRAVFEAKTERRDEAAHALSLYCLKRPRNPQDWRYLVRSLPLIEGEQSRSVLRALARFRIRATKAKWLRQVILVGLPLDADGQAEAVALLSQWAGTSTNAEGVPLKTISDWQQWFAGKYPEQPAPVLTQDPANARWKFADLRTRLATEVESPERLQHGKAVYEKATCSKCHRKDGFGEQWAPDLSSLGWRLQKKEQLEATLFPSHRLNEEYPTFTVITKAGRVFNGTMLAAGGGEIRIVASDGKVSLLPQTEIDEAVESNRSSMPDGLLEPLAYEEIRDLFLYLDHLGPNADTTPRAGE